MITNLVQHIHCVFAMDADTKFLKILKQISYTLKTIIHIEIFIIIRQFSFTV